MNHVIFYDVIVIVLYMYKSLFSSFLSWLAVFWKASNAPRRRLMARKSCPTEGTLFLFSVLSSPCGSKETPLSGPTSYALTARSSQAVEGRRPGKSRRLSCADCGLPKSHAFAHQLLTGGKGTSCEARQPSGLALASFTVVEQHFTRCPALLNGFGRPWRTPPSDGCPRGRHGRPRCRSGTVSCKS